MKTQNESWGFYGTINGDKDAAWTVAFVAIEKATKQPAEAVRAFLDSCAGRHFAGQVNREGLQNTTACWMNWATGREVRREFNIAKGTPYLIGKVMAAHKGA